MNGNIDSNVSHSNFGEGIKTYSIIVKGKFNSQ